MSNKSKTLMWAKSRYYDNQEEALVKAFGQTVFVCLVDTEGNWTILATDDVFDATADTDGVQDGQTENIEEAKKQIVATINALGRVLTTFQNP